MTTLEAPDTAVDMKALSLWQPWASMVARGIKTIETRSWSTKHRGPLAIHATAPGTKADYSDPVWDALRADGHVKGGVLLDSLAPLAFGAVVATCTLVDVVPIIDPDDCEWHHEHPRSVGPLAHAAIDGQVIIHRPDAPMHTTVLCELPYGDYTPGRFAWVLQDVERLDPPFPARGRQQLWTWRRAEGSQ